MAKAGKGMGMDHELKNYKTERERELGRKTWQKIGKRNWNYGRQPRDFRLGKTSNIPAPGLPSGHVSYSMYLVLGAKAAIKNWLQSIRCSFHTGPIWVIMYTCIINTTGLKHWPYLQLTQREVTVQRVTTVHSVHLSTPPQVDATLHNRSTPSKRAYALVLQQPSAWAVQYLHNCDQPR